MRTSFLLLSLLLSVNCFAGTYKWVDANGKVQYSDMPPANQGNATKMRSSGSEGGSSSGFQSKSLAEREKELKEKQTKDKIAQERKDMSEKDKADKERNCKAAQGNKRMLEAGGRIRTTDEKGEQSFMTPTEIQQKLDQVNQDIKQFCG